VSDIDTAAADSLKVLDPKRPIREADMSCPLRCDARYRQTPILLYFSRHRSS
jgi:hypothetical protein